MCEPGGFLTSPSYIEVVPSREQLHTVECGHVIRKVIMKAKDTRLTQDMLPCWCPPLGLSSNRLPYATGKRLINAIGLTSTS